MKDIVDVSVIVPTYNEKDNVGILVDRIDKTLQDTNYEIIFIDDDSPDKTGDTVLELSKRYPLKLITRKNEKGLATAVVEGFKQAKGDVFVVMDADLQHPPEKILTLIGETLNGIDLTVGSRYIEKDSFGEFSLIRKIISKSANTFAKILLPKLAEVKDLQSGFFAVKKDVVKNVDLRPTGYKILLEILIVGNYNNVKEIPIKFGKREKGESKLGIGVIFDYLKHLMVLYWRQNKKE